MRGHHESGVLFATLLAVGCPLQAAHAHAATAHWNAEGLGSSGHFGPQQTLCYRDFGRLPGERN